MPGRSCAPHVLWYAADKGLWGLQSPAWDFAWSCSDICNMGPSDPDVGSRLGAGMRAAGSQASACIRLQLTDWPRKIERCSCYTRAVSMHMMPAFLVLHSHASCKPCGAHPIYAKRCLVAALYQPACTKQLLLSDQIL